MSKEVDYSSHYKPSKSLIIIGVIGVLLIAIISFVGTQPTGGPIGPTGNAIEQSPEEFVENYIHPRARPASVEFESRTPTMDIATWEVQGDIYALVATKNDEGTIVRTALSVATERNVADHEFEMNKHFMIVPDELDCHEVCEKSWTDAQGNELGVNILDNVDTQQYWWLDEDRYSRTLPSDGAILAFCFIPNGGELHGQGRC